MSYLGLTAPVIAPGNGTVTPATISQGGPSWDTSGNVTLTGNITLNNGTADGAQLVLQSSGSSDWNWDNYSGRLRAYYGATEYFTITNSGNVGIGTSSPQQQLHLNGSASMRYSNSANTSGFDVGLLGGGADPAVYMYQRANSFIAIGTNNTERVRIDSSGNLLVGKTSGTVAPNGCWLSSTGESFNTITSAYNTLHVYSSTASAYRFYVSAAGQINATSTSITAISDASLKENIRDIDTGLQQVMALQPRRFDWKEETGIGEKNVAGFIAQELEQVLPELVYEYQYNSEETKKSIKMGDILPTLVKAIQEQQAQISSQAAVITSLTERIAALENK